MVKILINKATILTLSMVQKPVISSGYVYISNGRIQEVGEGDPPEELRYPELILNGKERIVAPGLSSGFTVVTLYPLRFGIGNFRLSDWVDYYRKLDRTVVYYIAGISFIELAMRGVTSALVSDIYLDSIARAAVDAGIYVTLAPPFNCGLEEFGPKNELGLLLNRWHDKKPNIRVGILSCGTISEDLIQLSKKYSLPIYLLHGEDLEKTNKIEVICINPKRPCRKSIFYSGGLKNWSPDHGIGIGVSPSYSMTDTIRKVSELTKVNALDALNSAINVNPKLLGYSNIGSIDAGNVANLIMFNTSEPPGWPPPVNLELLIRAIVNGELRIESSIMGENIIIDSGEPLTLGYDFVTKAKERIQPILKEFSQCM